MSAEPLGNSFLIMNGEQLVGFRLSRDVPHLRPENPVVTRAAERKHRTGVSRVFFPTRLVLPVSGMTELS
jgi:hypothetical protein